MTLLPNRAHIVLHGVYRHTLTSTLHQTRRGVGQTLYVTMWLDKVTPTATGLYGDVWHNYTLTITKPDGTKLTQGPFTAGAAAGYATTFTPDTTGNYTFVSISAEIHR